MSKPTLEKCRHGVLTIGCHKCAIIEDAGRRMAETINLKVVCQPWDTICNGWMAFNLGDGTSDNVVYDTRKECVDHQVDERWFCYFFMRNAMGGAQPLDCQLFINTHRQAYEANRYFRDPQIIMSTRGYDVMTGRVNPYD